MSKPYDLLIVGAGPAGMSAAIYAKNDGIRFRLFEGKDPGWFTKVSTDSHYTVDNYLGFPEISGTQLINKFKQHLSYLKVKTDRASQIEDIFEEDMFKAKISDGEIIEFRTIILATGTKPKKLPISGIEKLIGKNVFYYCVEDGDKYKGKEVLVVGGRNTGAVTSIYLKNLGCDVLLIEKDPQLNATPKYIQRLNKLKINYLTSTVIDSLSEEDNINKVILAEKSKKKEVHPEAIFLCIGLEPNNKLAKKLNLKLDNRGYISVDQNMQTSNKKVFAAGDITGNLKQIVVAAAQGAIAEYNINKIIKCEKK